MCGLLLTGPTALLKFFGLQCAENLKELKRLPRLTLKDGEAVAEAIAGITESELPKLITDELCKFLKTRAIIEK